MTRVSAAGLLFAAACAHAGPDPWLVPGFDPMCGCGKCAAVSLPTDPRGPVYSGREASTDTDVQTVDLDLEVTFGATPVLKGSNTMRVRSTVNGLTQFTFMLRTNFTVQRNNSGNAADNNRVTLNGGTVATCTTPGANSYARTVTLDRAYNAGEEFTVRVDFSGEPVSRGFGSIFVGTQNGVDLAASLSEPYYAATWWPVKDGDVFLPGNNADKFTGSIAITVPSALKGVANGLLTSVTNPAAGKTRYRWTTNYQTAPYLFAFSATNYNQWAVNYSYPLPGGGTGTSDSGGGTGGTSASGGSASGGSGSASSGSTAGTSDTDSSGSGTAGAGTEAGCGCRSEGDRGGEGAEGRAGRRFHDVLLHNAASGRGQGRQLAAH